MLSQRCSGLLICEHLGELRDERGRICLATRCVNCGCIEDSVVRANRLHHPGKRVGSSGRCYNWRNRVPAKPHCEVAGGFGGTDFDHHDVGCKP